MGGADGRSVIVTGSARGIGTAIAARFAAAGDRVGLVDRDPEVARVAERLGGAAACVDLADVEATRSACKELLDRLDGCWCLVNNAGVFAKAPLLELDPASWDDVMAINARAMLVTMQCVAPAMIERGGGRIVNQASMAAKLGTPGEAAYAASKAAVVALTRVAAMELGPHNVTVNAICPGYVLTDMGADTRDPDQVAQWTAKSPLGRLGTPEDVAALVVHLASDDASYITGEALNVTGGMCTW
jgi:NAD(P)-dependent dehydrogenase (short-subunit alcohol dehydrogenase family)